MFFYKRKGYLEPEENSLKRQLETDRVFPDNDGRLLYPGRLAVCPNTVKTWFSKKFSSALRAFDLVYPMLPKTLPRDRRNSPKASHSDKEKLTDVILRRVHAPRSCVGRQDEAENLEGRRAIQGCRLPFLANSLAKTNLGSGQVSLRGRNGPHPSPRSTSLVRVAFTHIGPWERETWSTSHIYVLNGSVLVRSHGPSTFSATSEPRDILSCLCSRPGFG